MLRKLLTVLVVVLAFASVSGVAADPAFACRDYDGHRNSVVPPSCGSSAGYDAGYSAGSEASGSGVGSVDAAIDAVGLPPIFHTIAARESGGDPYAVNPSSGACGPFQFLPSTAASLGYTCADLTDPYTAAEAALALYNRDGLSPWAATAY
jgi:Transglycosylase SLT domain